MKIRKLIALLAAVLMLASVMPLSVFAEMGGDFPWTGTSDKMLVEEILERDGLIDGIWFPWFNAGETGHNLTGNDLMADYYNSSSTKNWDRVEMDYYGADKIYREIYNLKAMGYNMLAYSGSIMAEGVIFDANGDVIGIKEEYLNNARRLLNMCREIGMPVMWNVYFHCSSMPQYYGIDGWKVVCQMLGNNDIADHYAENFVRPLCEMLAEYPDVVALVSIADEPENEINDLGIGNHYEGERALYGVNQDDMIYFMQQINEVVREELPNVARTVASNSGNKTIYRDFDLDLMGHNQYTDGDTFKSVESLITDADPILTEYNIGSSVAYDDEAYAEKLITYREWMINNGYKGGFQWCWMTNAAATTGKEYYLQRSKTDPTAFRKTVTLLKYYMDEYRAEHRGETLGLVAPVLYANTGDGVVKFIPSKLATKITIQRSDDGGSTWKTLASNLTQSNYVDEYLIGTYTDNTTKPTSGYCYRIIATDGTSTVTSEPNDLAGTDATFKKTYTAPTYAKGQYYLTGSVSSYMTQLTSFGVEANRPLNESFNLIENGSFESTGGQWNTSSFLTYAQVVSDSTTPLGSKSLYFNTSSVSTKKFYTFTVTGLKANTEYTFSAFLKGAYLANDNKGFGSIGVIDPYNNQYMVYKSNYPRASRLTQQLCPTAWDDEWHLRSVSFNTGSRTSYTIALYGYSSKMWVDGMALFESTNGGKYENGESAKAITSTTYNPASGATNAVADPSVNNASYWNVGAGYKQGFMSIASGALKYTASSDPKGVRYTKWIDVKPGTDYYVSYTVKVTTAGNGRVAILDNAKLLPNENLTQSFSSTGTKTVTGRISTGKYDQLGLCVVDLGGVATIDNIYFYEAGESVEVPTEPSFDGYIINGNFEIGSSNNWENLWNNNTVEMVEGRNSLFAMKVSAGQYTHVRQFVAVEPNTDYIIELWTKGVTSTALMIKDGGDTTNIKNVGLPSGSTWTKTTVEFNSGENTEIIVSLMGSASGATYTVDDISMRKKTTVSDDGFIINGDFEVGASSNWENVWGSNTITIVDGYNSSYGMKVNANLYTVVRQTVTVKPNTDYVIEAWVKDCVNANLLVKDQADKVNILNVSLPGGSTWTKVTAEFNSGSETSVFVGFMGAANGAYYTVDNVTMYEKEVVSGGLLNGDFEDGEDNWTFGSGSHAIVGDAHGGNNALQLTNPSAWGEAAMQIFDVEQNTSYTITWWYKATSGTGTYNLIAMNASGWANLSTEGGKNWMNNYTGAWQQGTYVVNSGSATQMALKFTTEATNPGTILVDDVVVVKTEDFVCQHSYTASVTKAPTCGATGIRTYTCAACGDSYTETIAATGAHTYDNACDASCNVCGATRTVTHVYSGACDQYCNLCGAKKSGFSIGVAHTYDNACDADCNVCGEQRNVAGHTYDNACDADCNKCGAVREVGDHVSNAEHPCVDGKCVNCGIDMPATADHSYDNACDADCNVCGTTREVGDHVSNAEHPCVDGKCVNCGTDMPATADHSYDNACDADCNNCGTTREVGDHVSNAEHPCVDGKCVNCGTDMPAAADHSYDNACDVDCNNCGTTRQVGDHVSNAEHPCVDGNCIHCGTDLPAAADHSYDNACDADCNVCGTTREVGDHQYVGEQTKAPTCGNTGVMTYTCSSCGVSYTVAIPATDEHTFSCDCQVECTKCHYEREPIDYPHHTEYYGDGMGSHYKNNICHLCGEMVFVGYFECTYTDVLACQQAECIYCGDRLPAAAEHDYVTEVHEATCDNFGYIEYTCSVCGDYDTEIIPATGHPDRYFVEGTEATCTTFGTLDHWYCPDCDGYWIDESFDTAYDETIIIIPMKDHVVPDSCTGICQGCGQYIAHMADHNVDRVEAVESTCTTQGNIMYRYCVNCGMHWDKLGTEDPNEAIDPNSVYLPLADHTYDHAFDTTCNECGAVRDVVAPDTLIAFGGNSVSEDVSGLAFRFDVAVDGMAANGTTAIYDGATINGYKLISMGAIVTNKLATLDIPAVYLCGLEEGSASFAVRVINIPADKLDVAVTATPYVVVEIDGVQTTIYGEAQTSTYNEGLNG